MISKPAILCLLALSVSVYGAPIDRDDSASSRITVYNEHDTPVEVVSVYAHDVDVSDEPLTKDMPYVKLSKESNQVTFALRILRPVKTMYAKYTFTLSAPDGSEEIVHEEHKFVQHINHLCLEGGTMVDGFAHGYHCKKTPSVKMLKTHLPTHWRDAEHLKNTVSEMTIEMTSAEGVKMFKAQIYVWLAD